MLVSLAALTQIRNALGPKSDEGMFTIMRGAERKVAVAGGFVDGTPSVVATVSGRLQYIGTMTSTEKEREGLERFDADYIGALEAFSDIRIQDMVDETGPAWVSQTGYLVGSRVAVGGVLYLAITAGASGTTSPAWAPTLGALTTDGGVTWRSTGPGRAFHCMGVLDGTYSTFISRTVALKTRAL